MNSQRYCRQPHPCFPSADAASIGTPSEPGESRGLRYDATSIGILPALSEVEGSAPRTRRTSPSSSSFPLSWRSWHQECLATHSHSVTCALSVRSLKQERFTTLFESTASALFFKIPGGCTPLPSFQPGPNILPMPRTPVLPTTWLHAATAPRRRYRLREFCIVGGNLNLGMREFRAGGIV